MNPHREEFHRVSAERWMWDPWHASLSVSVQVR